MNEEKEKIMKKILSRVGKKGKTVFTFPETIEGKRRKLKGTLVSRYPMYIERSILRDEPPGATDYIDVIDLIEFEPHRGKKFRAIRFGYYRKDKNGKWIWGSQTTLTERTKILEKLFKKAAETELWFSDILKKSIGVNLRRG